jgi:hypothetical protein
MKIENMNGKRLLSNYDKEKQNLDQVIKELNISKEATVTRKEKDKNSTIKHLEQTARNFTTFSDRKNTNVRNASTNEETENFWKEILGKKNQP